MKYTKCVLVINADSLIFDRFQLQKRGIGPFCRIIYIWQVGKLVEKRSKAVEMDDLGLRESFVSGRKVKGDPLYCGRW